MGFYDNWTDEAIEQEMQGLRKNMKMARDNNLIGLLEGYANRLDSFVYEKERRRVLSRSKGEK